MASDSNTGKIGKRRVVSGHDHSICRPSGRCDNQVMRPSGSSLTSHGDEKLRMGFCDIEVVVDDRDRRDDVFDEALSFSTRRIPSELGSDYQLSDRDRRDRDVIIVRYLCVGAESDRVLRQ